MVGIIVRSVVWLVLLALVGGAPAVAGSSPRVEEARTLFRHYHEDLSRIDRARALLEEIVREEPSLDALVLLAWVHLTWADHRAGSREEKAAGYERGRDTAQRALAVAPRNAEAHLWYAANLGRWAVLQGKVKSAFLLPTLRSEARTILDLAPDHPAGLSFAGSLELETPGFLGGDVARAEAYQRQALAADPHFTRARVELAKCLIAQNRHAEARQELSAVLEETRPAHVADWTVRHRPMAERLLRDLRAKS